MLSLTSIRCSGQSAGIFSLISSSWSSTVYDAVTSLTFDDTLTLNASSESSGVLSLTWASSARMITGEKYDDVYAAIGVSACRGGPGAVGAIHVYQRLEG